MIIVLWLMMVFFVVNWRCRFIALQWSWYRWLMACDAVVSGLGGEEPLGPAIIAFHVMIQWYWFHCNVMLWCCWFTAKNTIISCRAMINSVVSFGIAMMTIELRSHGASLWPRTFVLLLRHPARYPRLGGWCSGRARPRPLYAPRGRPKFATLEMGGVCEFFQVMPVEYNF